MNIFKRFFKNLFTFEVFFKMNVKLMIVLTIVLCAFCVLPVNASLSVGSAMPTNWNLGVQQYTSVNVTYNNYVDLSIFNVNNVEYYCYQSDYDLLTSPAKNDYTIVTWFIISPVTQVYGTRTVNVYVIDKPEIPLDEFDIDIDLQENPTFELGNITSLEQYFEIGSSSNRVVKNYESYATRNSEVIDLERNFVKIKLNPNYNYGEIFLSGKALLNTVESDFTTKASFNYTYIPSSDLQAIIQTFDYQSGNMVSGVNLSVYEVIDNGDSMSLRNVVFSSISAESQTILMLKNNTDYFVKNELGGYLAVKNTEYPSLNNEVGYLWTPSITNPLILYYSRLDPTAQYNVGFIVQDTSNNGLSGVSVTMDNSVTKISNSIGGVTFNNVSSGSHSFTFVKNGYQSAQITKDIQMQYATFTQTLFAENQIIQPTTQPTAYPTVKPTTQPTIKPVEQPKNIADSVKYGLAHIFGVNSLETINLVFALIIILFPAVVGGVITSQALGFVAGGMFGFVFALAIGLLPIWVFFCMVLFTVLYLIMTTGDGF